MAEIAKRESLGRDELENLVALALDEARRLGVDQAEVAASQDMGLSTTARLGDVESLEFTNDRGIGITVYKNACKGNASTSDTSPAAIREAVAKACSFATFTAEDPYSGLADAELMAKDILDLDLDHPWELDANQAIALAIESENAAMAFRKGQPSQPIAVHVPTAIRMDSLAVIRGPVTASPASYWLKPMVRCSGITITHLLASRAIWMMLRQWVCGRPKKRQADSVHRR